MAGLELPLAVSLGVSVGGAQGEGGGFSALGSGLGERKEEENSGPLSLRFEVHGEHGSLFLVLCVTDSFF